MVLDDLRHWLQPLREAVEETVHPAKVVRFVVRQEDLAPAAFLLEQDFLSAWCQGKTTTTKQGSKLNSMTLYRQSFGVTRAHFGDVTSSNIQEISHLVLYGSVQ